MTIGMDTGLVLRARAGDKAAFGELVEGHQPMAERIARRVVGDEDLAKELAQEGILQAYLSIGQLRTPERFQSWLHGIVLNVCRSYLRDQKIDFYSLEALTGGLRHDSLPIGNLDPDPQEVAEARELQEVVLSAVEELSPKNRVAALMYYYDGLSVREIAATLGVSIAAVKGRLHKGRAHLRAELSARLIDYGAGARKEIGRMVQVDIADILISKKGDDEGGDGKTSHIVILLDRQGRRVLPIWVGPAEGNMIAVGQSALETPRPMTYTFVTDMLKAAGVKLDRVRIDRLLSDTFYATAELSAGGKKLEVEARPSDAIALATYAGAPVFAAEEVMDKAGVVLPEEVVKLDPAREGIESMVEGLKGHVEQQQRHSEEWEARTEAENRQRIVDAVTKQLPDLFSRVEGKESPTKQ